GGRHSKPRERAGQHHRLDLCRSAKDVCGRHETGVQMRCVVMRDLRAILGAAAMAAVFTLWHGGAFAQMNHQHASEAACEETVLRCASKVTPAFAADGTLWLVWMAGGQISVASSKDEGKTFSSPVQVTRENLNLDWGPDARPKIAVDGNGRIA